MSNKVLGSSEVCIAILDGQVDLNHPCFQGADLTLLPSLVSDGVVSDGRMSLHGTHVTSILFGQPGSPVVGISPRCKGLIIPVFSDGGRSPSQLDLARAIEQAVNAGAHIINISGGQLTDEGEAEGWLERAVQLCQDNNVLIVAAAGNDGCDCLHVPAALPAVLAVGAMDGEGQPMAFSNWGEIYQKQGILASGENILGARPDGGTVQLSGTSFATPIVAGVTALLLSLQMERGETPDPQKVRTAILQTALPCHTNPEQGHQCLAGMLNTAGLFELFTGGIMSEPSEAIVAAGCGCGNGADIGNPGEGEMEEISSSGTPDEQMAVRAQSEVGENAHPEAPRDLVPAGSAPPVGTSVAPSIPAVAVAQPSLDQISTHQSSNRKSSMSKFVTASQAPSDLVDSQLVYALGTLGYDFGSEARRDSFKQLMPAYTTGDVTVPANPHDARQMVDYLGASPSEARSLIWTLNIELTPVYAIEPEGAYGRDVYAALQELLAGQVQSESSESYVERVSIPGILTGRTVKLFSGQVVPLIVPQSPRGIYGWKVNTLVNAAMETVQTTAEGASEEAMRRTLGSFLNRIYYDLRNLGTTSQDRAINFAATNAFQAASAFAEAVATGMELDSINVEKSPFCRQDSDCWDVKLKFFDPENSLRAKKIFRFTIDVSDLIPVTLGEVRTWSSPY
ncbi:S8 family peptidase [Adonisia turfae]|uniref:PatA/PatG family cyanobactin maturation protease n=1 Tax=Adonisia turfae CCMR0081 TaxID=2292702 RepID=A0A6M0RID4_9CYAN|nr:PatA/PatG family cyanobactin maturation protease [Adonisia turfae]NEZ56018.1 PatA/PatG family cyanobactin maturation protease [Adonisia turfae CCMR0081]